jgi:hypothetical protein
MEILMYDHQKHIAKEIPVEVDDLRDLEMYEIMRQPVIAFPEQKMPPIRNRADLRLEILCCSHFENCMFIYLFSGREWKSYYVILNKPNL